MESSRIRRGTRCQETRYLRIEARVWERNRRSESLKDQKRLRIRRADTPNEILAVVHVSWNAIKFWETTKVNARKVHERYGRLAS